MTAREKFWIVGVVALLIAISIFGAMEVRQHEALAVAGASSKTLDASKTAAETQIADLQKRLDARDASDVVQQKQTADLIKSVQTIAQIKAAMPSLITLPSAPSQVTAAQAAQINASAAPDAPKVQAGDFVVSQDDAKPLFDKLAQCSADQKSLQACSAAREDITDQLAQEKLATAAETQKAAVWEKAAKGGSVAHRVWVAVKWGAPIVAGAYAAGRLHK